MPSLERGSSIAETESNVKGTDHATLAGTAKMRLWAGVWKNYLGHGSYLSRL